MKKSKPLTAKEKALLKEGGLDPDADPKSFWGQFMKKKGIKPRKPKPHKHGRLEKYGSFTEFGYDVTAYICDATKHPHFLIEVKKDGKIVRRKELPSLMYGARFGVDIDDKALLEDETDKILKELKKSGKKKPARCPPESE